MRNRRGEYPTLKSLTINSFGFSDVKIEFLRTKQNLKTGAIRKKPMPIGWLFLTEGNLLSGRESSAA